MIWSRKCTYQGQLQGIRDYVLKLGLFSNQQTTVENAELNCYQFQFQSLVFLRLILVFTFPTEKGINTNIIFSISVSEPSSREFRFTSYDCVCNYLVSAILTLKKKVFACVHSAQLHYKQIRTNHFTTSLTKMINIFPFTSIHKNNYNFGSCAEWTQAKTFFFKVKMAETK
jgi:hypothetical protein